MTFLKNINKNTSGVFLRMQRAKKLRPIFLQKSLAAVLIFILVASTTPISSVDGATTVKPQTIVATGGTVTTLAQNGVKYKIHTFTNTGSDTFRVISGSGKVWYLVVAGGGGGGWSNGGGGGGGGYRTNGGYDYAVKQQSYTVTVGAGGHGATGIADTSTNGGDSVFDTITSLGGGRGGSYNTTLTGSTGGSGGGGANGSGSPAAGSGTGGQGTAGGAGSNNAGPNYPAGGGGGATSAGASATEAGSNGGAGGAGTASSISGLSVTRGGGGGGASYATGGVGGAGGGGAGGTGAGGIGTAGTDGTGGGSGGSSTDGTATAHNGGSGIVIIRYPIGTVKTGIVAGDPYWNNVVALWVNDNAASSTNTFTDESKTAATLTANNGAVYSSMSAPTGMTTSARLAEGSGGASISAASNSLYDLPGDFTWEAMVNLDSAGSPNNFGARPGSFNITNQYGGAIRMQVFQNGSHNGFISNAWSPSSNTWYHIAISRSGSTVRTFLNGVQIGSNQTDTSNNTPSGSSVLIFGRYDYGLNGYFSNFRLTKGVARYTANFTPPTLPLPAGPLASATAVKPALTNNSLITATGGTITTITKGGITRKVHTFTTTGSDTFTVTSGSGKVWYLVVGGGGGGATAATGPSGGGGGGGVRDSGGYTYNVTPQSYSVTVGAGGSPGNNGGNSTFATITSTGGGQGGGNYVASSGGSGGGAGYTNSAIGNGIAGQGNNGGLNSNASGKNCTGGGGGAGAVGGSSDGLTSGAGGDGTSSAISGAYVFYGGGGGGTATDQNCIGGAGGLGGGGAGAQPSSNPGTSGTANTGGGGGGSHNQTRGSGGSGIVIISYITSKQNTSKNAPVNGLVGWWPMDSSFATDKIYDRSGRGNHGGFFNSATSSALVTGKIGQALSFDGSTNYVKVNDSSNLRATAAVTVSAWIYPTNSSVRGDIINKWGNQDAYLLRYGASDCSSGSSDQKLCFAIDEDGSEGAITQASSAATIPINTWTHVAGVFNGTSIKVYINGVENGSTSFASKSIFAGTSPLSIGAVNTDSSPTLFFPGRIDDVRVYNRALSASEVAQLYNSR